MTNTSAVRATRVLSVGFASVAFSCLLTAAASSQDLDTSVKNLFTDKGFDPHIIPFSEQGFDVTESDPLVLHAEWETVREPLSQLYAEHLGIARPPLVLQFGKATPKHGKFRARTVFCVKQDARLRAAISRHLGCPSHVFSTGRNVAEMRIVQLSAIRAKYKTATGLAHSVVLGDLLAMLQEDDGPFGRYNLSADGQVGRDEIGVLSGWKFYKQVGPAKRYFWRANLRVAKNNWGSWTLYSFVDLGRQLASQSSPKKVGDTHNDNVRLNLETGRGERAYVTFKTVDGNTSILPTGAVSPLGTLRARLTNECLNVLLEN